MRAIVVGNCQSRTFKNIAERMIREIEFDHIEAQRLDQDFFGLVESYDLAFVQPHIHERIEVSRLKKTRLITFPRCSFWGFHPDYVSLKYNGKPYPSTLVGHSAIIFSAWKNGLEREQALELLNENVFRALKFPEYFAVARSSFAREWSVAGLDAEPVFSRWMKLETPFMLTPVHPKIEILNDMTGVVLQNAGFSPSLDIELPPHHLENLIQFGVYPELSKMFGMSGEFIGMGKDAENQLRPVSLEAFVRESYAKYSKIKASAIEANKNLSAYDEIVVEKSRKTESRKSVSKRNPYAGIATFQNWRKSFAGVSASEVDPVVSCDFRIRETDLVATAGSCFAQHLARALKAAGLNYYAPESGDAGKGYGLYSARYGNVYTTAQLEQLFDRAYGVFKPHDKIWMTPAGVQVDPFRPEIPLDSSVEADREVHFGFVRQVFESCDYFVFTLGLTEAWRSKVDGAVFPIAPGVAAGAMDWDLYEFVNFDERTTFECLERAMGKIRSVNEKVKFILTVSPVPLMATFEPRHVLQSTTYSKSVLRVVAERAVREIRDVFYFPSYEIITGNYNRGAYFDVDLRSVKPEGVDHVMRLFLKHATEVSREQSIAQDIARLNDVLCAEEMLDVQAQ